MSIDAPQGGTAFSGSSLERYREEPLIGQTIRIIDVPTDWGKPRIGTQDGPEYVRQKGGIEMHLYRAGATIDPKRVAVPRKETASDPTQDTAGHVRDAEHVVSAGRLGGEQVKEALLKGEKVLSLRGDHSGALDITGALEAFPDPNDPEFSTLKIIWIDTHPDINGISKSPNGHGKMALTLLGQGHPDFEELMKGVPKLRSENIIYVGLSQPDNAEIDTLKALGITCYTSDDLEDKKAEMYQRINEFVSAGDPCWLEFDQDAMDDTEADGALMNSDEGMTKREVYSIARRFHFGGNGVGVGIAEVMPEFDKGGQAARIATGVASRALGAGNPQYQHGGYDAHEKREAEDERSEIKSLIDALEAKLRTEMQETAGKVNVVSGKVDGLQKLNRRHFLGLAAFMAGAKLIGDVVTSRQRPLLLDDGIFQNAVAEFKRAKEIGDHKRRESAERTMQSLVHLALQKARNDAGLRDGIWSAVRNTLGNDFDEFQQSFWSSFPDQL